MKIVSLLEHALKKKGIKYTDIAAKLDVTQGYISRIFSEGKMNTDHWDSIREAAGLSLSEILVEDSVGLKDLEARIAALEEKSQPK